MNAKRNKAWIARNSNNNQIIGPREKKNWPWGFNIDQKWGEGWEAVKTLLKKLLESFLQEVDIKLS